MFAAIALIVIIAALTFAFKQNTNDIAANEPPAEIPKSTQYVDEEPVEEEILPVMDEIVINELMTFNRWYLKPKEKNVQQDQNYYDWIEIKNISNHDINLSDYYLSDNENKLTKFKLPNEVLEPNGLFVVWCDSDDIFNINANETIYLTDVDGELQDRLDASGVRASCSCGRIDGKKERYIFTTPTPGKENENGYSEISSTPKLIGKDGVFNNTDSVSFKLESNGDIYYTLDGSVPTEQSIKYDGLPITIYETSVVRAATIEKDKLISDTLDLSFIINEGHSLPVTSLIMAPEDFDGDKSGIYVRVTEDIENPCSVKFMDGDDEFYIKSGIKIHGATSKLKQPKKSLRLKFRDVYDGDLNYNLFNKGAMEFDSLILRSAQELHISTQIRDIFFQQLAKKCYEDMPIQDYRFTVLYINGEYWGIYAYRETHTEQNYANHSSYNKSDIEVYEGKWPSDGEFNEIYKIAIAEDITKDEVYQKVSEHLDIDSVITWALIQGYSGNEDIEAHNVKFYYTKSDHKLHYAMADLDLGGDGRSHMPVGLWYDYGTLFNRLLTNKTFKDRLLQKASEYLHGPLSDEQSFALRDSIADEIRNEIPRDAERWNYKASDWESEVDRILLLNTWDHSCQQNFARTMKYAINIRPSDYEKYFSDIE